MLFIPNRCLKASRWIRWPGGEPCHPSGSAREPGGAYRSGQVSSRPRARALLKHRGPKRARMQAKLVGNELFPL